MFSLDKIKEEMLTQDKRSTAWPIFIVVEDRKVYGVDPTFRDCERERKDIDNIDEDKELCPTCRAAYDETGYLPEECGDCSDDSFITYRIEKDVPNMRAGFFFTAKACDAHIATQSHHYDASAKSYGISAFCNYELQTVMTHIVGEENVIKIT